MGKTPTTELLCDLPSSVSLQVTENCNLRCKMCYEWGENGRYAESCGKNKPPQLDIELLKSLIQELAPARPSYDLFGGEPLVYPHLAELILAIKEAGSPIETPTNGTLLKKHAQMLVQTKFDSVRVSIDGPKEINDMQRGRGSYDKALAGIQALQQEKQKAKSLTPVISVIFTITNDNYQSIERFFLQDLDLTAIDWVTIQMQNFITQPMGQAYARMLESEFDITSDRYWKGLVRPASDFDALDAAELARQVNTVCERLQEQGKNVLLLPPTFSHENISAYLRAQWSKMSDSYRKCPVPWSIVDIAATGDVAPCHIFYDLVMGNLNENSFKDIWNGKKYQTFRAHMGRHGLMPICHGCCILYLAGS